MAAAFSKAHFPVCVLVVPTWRAVARWRMAEGSPPRGQDEPGEQRCCQDDRKARKMGMDRSRTVQLSAEQPGPGRTERHSELWEGLGPRVSGRGRSLLDPSFSNGMKPL